MAPFDGLLQKLGRRRQALTGIAPTPPPATVPHATPAAASGAHLLDGLDDIVAAALAQDRTRDGGTAGDEESDDDLVVEDDAADIADGAQPQFGAGFARAGHAG